MNINFNTAFKLKGLVDNFFFNHPKSKTLIDDVKAKGFCEGQEIAVAVRYPDGTEYKAGIRLTQEDLELFNSLRNM